MADSQPPKRSRDPSEEENIKYEELSLGLLNINGLRNKTHEVRHIIARDKLHVVALCETKLNTTVKHGDVYIPGFSMWRKDRNDKSNIKGGGVALYVQDHIKTRLRPDLMKAEADVENPEAEIIWVEMQLPEGRPVLLGCCYRPTKDEKKYLKHIKDTINLISENDEDKDVFLMGDFNIDWNSDGKKKADEAIKKKGWTQIVDVSTRVTLDSETCIDHIYTNISHRLEPKYIPTGCSDHNLVTVKVSRKIPQSEANFRSNQFDREEFQKDIKVGKWSEVCKLTLPKEKENSNKLPYLKKALEEFTKIFLKVAHKYAPLKSQDIYCLLKLDAKLESFVSDRDKVKYKMINKIYNSVKIKKKLQEKIDNYLKPKPQNPPEGDENDAIESEETSPFHLPEIEAPEAGQQTYKTSTETTDSESLPEDIAGGQRNRRRSGGFSFEETRYTAVKRWLEYVCDHVVKVIDKTEAELLKLAADYISAPIRDILKGCTEIGEFPEGLKEIKSFPFSTDNYNQIRQSSGADRLHIILSYVFDVILYEQFKSFFIGNEKTSAETLKEKLEQLETDTRAVGAVLLDFTSSFDSISHDLLITNLEESDFLSSALELIKSFLSIHKGSSGLPGGSCLAQLLRIIIINDLKEKLEPSAVICNSYMMIYADGDPQTIERKLDDKMKTVNHWNKQFNISCEIRRKEFKPCKLSKILESMLRCHGDESNWIRAPGNMVKQNGDWKYDNVSKELELNFGPGSLQRFQRQNQKLSEDFAAGDISWSGGSERREM